VSTLLNTNVEKCIHLYKNKLKIDVNLERRGFFFNSVSGNFYYVGAKFTVLKGIKSYMFFCKTQ